MNPAHGCELTKLEPNSHLKNLRHVCFVVFGVFVLCPAPRSGLAAKKHIDVGAGVVDADYRGNVGVILFNFSDEDFAVSPGDRVAQMILEKIDMGATAVETEELPDTARGDGGFGSTGVSAAVGPGVKRPKVNGEVPDGTDKE